jgi:hypothetical protein
MLVSARYSWFPHYGTYKNTGKLNIHVYKKFSVANHLDWHFQRIFFFIISSNQDTRIAYGGKLCTWSTQIEKFLWRTSLTYIICTKLKIIRTCRLIKFQATNIRNAHGSHDFPHRFTPNKNFCERPQLHYLY